jgi:hypothetical protein
MQPTEANMDQNLKELNLLLLYLSGWEEDSRKNPGEKVYRAWKGYLFEVLNALEDENFILQFGNSKSVIVTEEGRKTAEQLKEKYFSQGSAARGTS